MRILVFGASGQVGRAVVDGVHRRVRACANCIKSGRVVKKSPRILQAA